MIQYLLPHNVSAVSVDDMLRNPVEMCGPYRSANVCWAEVWTTGCSISNHV